MPVADLYPLYLAKVERKGRTKDELDTVIEWLTGYSATDVENLGATPLSDFFGNATLNPNAHLITGKVCGVDVGTITDPLMRAIRYLDKLVDELARGKKLESILRG